MDCPIGTVRSRIFRAREAIDTHLEPLLDDKRRVSVPMKHEDEEFLSGLMDGEWRTLDVRRSVRTVCEDEALRTKWSRYHLARQAMKREPVIPGNTLAERVSRAIDDEPTYSNVTPIGAVARPGTGDVADESNAGDAVDGSAERPLADEARVPVAASAARHARADRRRGGAGGARTGDRPHLRRRVRPRGERRAVVTAFGLNALDGGSPGGGSGPVADAAAPLSSSGPVASAPPDPFSRQVPGAPLPNVELVANPRPDRRLLDRCRLGARDALSPRSGSTCCCRGTSSSRRRPSVRACCRTRRLVGYNESTASGGSAGGPSAGSAPDR